MAVIDGTPPRWQKPCQRRRNAKHRPCRVERAQETSASIITVVVAIIKFLSFDPRDDLMRQAFTEKNIKKKKR